MDHATREIIYVNNLVEPRQQNANDFTHILRLQKSYKISFWVYTPCGECKVELFKSLDCFDKDRKDVRTLVWVNHCPLNKSTKNLLDRPNKKNHKF